MSESWMKFYIKRIFLSCYKGVYELKRCLQFVVGVYLFDDQIYKNFVLLHEISNGNEIICKNFSQLSN